MKMTRNDLKNLVKECLVEILAEGLSETQQTINESRQMRTAAPVRGMSTSQVTKQPQNPRQSIADKISFLPKREEIREGTASVNQRTAALASSITSDPIMADIFADTARNGAYMSMSESSSGRVSHEQMIESAGDAASRAMLKSDPTDIFGESAGMWAALAFAEKVPTRS